ncbi:unnamed protein product [Cunninghamella blakesleeana]
MTNTNDEHELSTAPSSSSSMHLPTPWKSATIPLNRREQVHKYLGIIPPNPINQFHATNYQLIIREQPQQCRMSGFGEKDRRPIDPAPIIQLKMYNEEEEINLFEYQIPLCVIQASLWSSDCTQQLDVVQVIQKKSSSKVQSNPIRTLTGTLSSSPSLLRDLDDSLGVFFSFPDISVRVAQTYCLKFDLLLISDSSNSAEIVTHVFSDPFIVYPVKDFPGMKESSLLAKYLSKQGLKVSVRHSVRPKKAQSKNV